MKAEFRRRRDVIVKGLNQIPGVSCLTPQGAFYVFPNITKIGKTSQELADLLLNEAGVATLPGTAFGPAGQGYLRFSYVNWIQNIQLALQKVGQVMGAIRAYYFRKNSYHNQPGEGNTDSTFLPSPISVFTEGDRVVLTTLKPRELIAHFNAPELKATAEEVEGALTKIMREAAA